MSTKVLTCELPREVRVMLSAIVSPRSAFDIMLTSSPEQQIIIIDDLSINGRVTLSIAHDAVVNYQFFFDGEQYPERYELFRELVLQCSGVGGKARAHIGCTTHAQQNIHFITLQEHLVPHTTSSLVIKGVSAARSKVQVNTMIRVHKAAQQTVALQEHKHFLLDKTTRVYSEPKLEVSADNVQCKHGAALCHIDDAHLFYLQSRGLSANVAQKAVIDAFLAPNF